MKIYLIASQEDVEKRGSSNVKNVTLRVIKNLKYIPKYANHGWMWIGFLGERVCSPLTNKQKKWPEN